MKIATGKSGLLAVLAAHLVSGDDFQGYRLLSNGAQPEYCPQSSEFFTTSAFAGCCPGTRGCNIATACSNGTYTFLFDRATGSCGTNNPVCLTRTIFAYPSASESWSLVLCTPSGRPTTESLFLETTAPGSSPSTASLPSPTSGVPNLPSSTTSGGNTPPSSTPVDQLEEAQSTSSESKAWIAGAVIGPIVAIAIVGFIGYWFGIRRARKKGDLQVEGQGPPSGPDQVQVPGMQNHHHGGGYYDPKAAAAGPPGASEMAGSIPPPGGSGADHSKPYYAGNYPANLDSNPVHELSHTSQAYELPADNTGHNHQERDR